MLDELDWKIEARGVLWLKPARRIIKVLQADNQRLRKELQQARRERD